MGESDPMTLQTRYRIGKLHFLSDNKEEVMEELGDVYQSKKLCLVLTTQRSQKLEICLTRF